MVGFDLIGPGGAFAGQGTIGVAGPGVGGHCIPIDPFYLTWKAKEVGFDTRFIELAGENPAQAQWVERARGVVRDHGKAHPAPSTRSKPRGARAAARPGGTR